MHNISDVLITSIRYWLDTRLISYLVSVSFTDTKNQVLMQGYISKFTHKVLQEKVCTKIFILFYFFRTPLSSEVVHLLNELFHHQKNEIVHIYIIAYILFLFIYYW